MPEWAQIAREEVVGPPPGPVAHGQAQDPQVGEVQEVAVKAEEAAQFDCQDHLRQEDVHRRPGV